VRSAARLQRSNSCSSRTRRRQPRLLVDHAATWRKTAESESCLRYAHGYQLFLSETTRLCWLNVVCL
jgi:hypothetical protein